MDCEPEDSTSESESEESMNENAEDATEASPEITPEVYLPGKTLERGEELVVDLSAYRLLHQAQTGAPCLSFDIIPDPSVTSDTYPLSLQMVAGTQAARAHVNSLIVMKMTNLTNTSNDDDDESDSDGSDDEETDKSSPKMNFVSIKHQGCVNRVRSAAVGDATLVASWSELGKVSIWNIEEQLKAVNSSAALAGYNKKVEKEEAKAVFTFKGHLAEGYGVDWCPTEDGTLATGDCRGNIHLWKYTGGSWHVDQRSFNSHAPNSVEDLQWSPSERCVLASCSVDKR